MASNSKIKGWQSYPRNLSGVDIDGHEYNFESYCRQLTADSARLLVGVTDDINIKTIRVESKGIYCQSESISPACALLIKVSFRIYN
jgi:hypothetical protein